MQYLDMGALLKRYVAEPDSDLAERLLQEDPDWVAAAHTEVEVHRDLARVFARHVASLERARQDFLDDWARYTSSRGRPDGPERAAPGPDSLGG